MRIQRLGLGLTIAGLVIGTGVFWLGRQRNIAQAEVSPTRTPNLFSALKSGESAVLDYKSEGCFASQHYRFEYDPQPVSHVTVTDLGTHYEQILWTNRTRKVSSQHLGTVTLTPEQIRRFDNLLRFYRTKRKGGCTNHDTIALTTFRNKQKLSVENFNDNSCESYDLMEADVRDLQAIGRKEAPVLSIGVLIKTAKESAKWHVPLPYPDTPRKATIAYRTAQRKHEEEVSKHNAMQMVTTMPGYSQIATQFNITDADLRSGSYFPYSLSVNLKTKSSRLINMAGWDNLVTNNRPQYNWDQFMTVYSSAAKLAERFPWLVEWKKVGSGRTIDCSQIGLTPDTEHSPSDYVLPAWRHAGLKGKPFCELTLVRSDHTNITVYLGQDDPRALLVSADGVKTDRSNLPIDNLKPSPENTDGADLNIVVLYHPTEKIPDYAVILPDGTVQRNTRPDMATRTWFIKKNNLNLK